MSSLRDDEDVWRSVDKTRQQNVACCNFYNE